MPLEQIDALRKLVQQHVSPDCTLLLDAPLTVGMGRASRRAAENNEQTDRFESEDLAFFEKVREGFLALAACEPRFTLIDASQPLEVVQQAVEQQLREMIGVQS